MLGFFKKEKQKKQSDNFLALDIGTEYVKAIIFNISETDHKLHVLGTGKIKQHPNAMQGAMVVNIEHVVNACDSAIGKAITKAEESLARTNSIPLEQVEIEIPEFAIMGIAGELVKGVSINAEYERENPLQKINAEEMDSAIEQIRTTAFVNKVQEISESVGIPVGNLEEIRSSINSTFIDGVKIDDPKGFTGKQVVYKVYSTFAPSIHINSLRQMASILQLNILGIEVQPYAITRAIRGGRANDFSAIIIDIGGGTTDVAVIDKGSIVDTKMFALGGRVLTKRIANGLGVDLVEAEELKIKYSSGSLSTLQSEKIRKIIEPDLFVWAEGVELALTEMSDISYYPTKIYLCGGGSALPEVKYTLQQYPWLQRLSFLKHPNVEFLLPSGLCDVVDETGFLNSPADITPLSLALLYFDLV